MRICYYNRLLNEPRGCGVHARSLVENWRRQGHEVLCLPRALTPPGPQVDSGVRDLSALPPFVRALAHEASARVRAARSASRLAGLVVEFAPDLLVTRRAGYDYCLDGVLAKTSSALRRRGQRHRFAGSRGVQRRAGACVGEGARARVFEAGCRSRLRDARTRSRGCWPRGCVRARTAVLPNGVDAQLFSPRVVPDEPPRHGHAVIARCSALWARNSALCTIWRA